MSVARQPSGRPACWPAARWVVTTGSSRAGAGWMGRRAQPSTLPPQPSSTRRRHRQVPHLLTPQRNKPPAEITTYPTRDSSIPLQPRHFVTQPAPPGQANLTGRDARSANLDHRGCACGPGSGPPTRVAPFCDGLGSSSRVWSGRKPMSTQSSAVQNRLACQRWLIFNGGDQQVGVVAEGGVVELSDAGDQQQV